MATTSVTATTTRLSGGTFQLPKNARFWEFVNNSPVKLTLKDGQSLHHTTWYRHEEGWTSHTYLWAYSDGYVIVSEHSDGVDCDGRLERFSQDTCSLEDLAQGGEYEGIRFPRWTLLSASQRDYSAEAMGY